MCIITYDYFDKKIYHRNITIKFELASEANDAWKNLKVLEKEGLVHNIRPSKESNGVITPVEKKFSVAFVRFTSNGREYSYKIISDIKPIKNGEKDEYLVLTKNGIKHVPAENVRFKNVTSKELQYPYEKMTEFVNIKLHHKNIDCTVVSYKLEKNGTYAVHVEFFRENLRNEFGESVPESMITTPYFNTWKEAVEFAREMIKQSKVRNA